MTALRGILVGIGRLLWLLAGAAGCWAGVELAHTITAAASAPQQAAGAAVACGWAIIPYVVARAWGELIASVDLGPFVRD